MQVAILASGSKGNSVYVELDGVRILVDAGISAARITKGLHVRGIEPQSLDAVLVTHEHIDHVRYEGDNGRFQDWRGFGAPLCHLS